MQGGMPPGGLLSASRVLTPVDNSGWIFHSCGMKFLLASVVLFSSLLFAEDVALPTELAQLKGYIADQEKEGKLNKEKEGWRTQMPDLPPLEFDGKTRYLWILETSEGELKMELTPLAAPRHVANVLYLTEAGYYDGLIFHRIIPGFMAQGGCPQGSGRAGPGYTLPLEAKSDLKHERGVLSMARKSFPVDSAGSQFFLMFGRSKHLDGGYSIFGTMLEGEETLKAIEAAGSPVNNGMNPKKRIEIRKARLEWEPANT